MAKRKKKNPESGPLFIGDEEAPTNMGNWEKRTFKTSWASKDIHDDRRVRIADADGKVLADVAVIGYSTDYNALKREFPSHTEGKGKDSIDYVTMPAEWLWMVTEVTLAKRDPMMCLYNSVKDYCESILGVKFCDEDREFFRKHPLTEPDGVPFPDTLRVAQELIDPYGLAISRVQAQPNYGVKGDMLQWRGVLGCNPLALGDRMTSNQEFVEKLKLNGEDLSKYKFEYTHAALFPSIACGTVSGGSTAGYTGFTNGHAVYIPPRRRVHGAMLSFQIERKREGIWRKPPVFPEITTSTKTQMCFHLTEWYDHYRKDKTVGYSVSGWKGPNNNKNTNLVPMKEEKGPVKPPCFMCKRTNAVRKHTYEYPGVCDECFDLFISEHWCTTNTCWDASTQSHPHFRMTAFHAKGQRVYLQCPTCWKTYCLEKGDKGKHLPRFFAALTDYMKENKLPTYNLKSTGAPRNAPPEEPATDAETTTPTVEGTTPNDTIPPSS